MTIPDNIYRQRFWNRLLTTRRKYFFEKIKDRSVAGKAPLKSVLIWLKDDIFYHFRWTLNILLQIRKYGLIIKRNYGVSRIRQAGRMFYLLFVVRTNPDKFRKYRLFKQKNWNKVDSYIYVQSELQRTFSRQLFPHEMDLFLNKFRFFEFCKQHQVPTPNVLAVYDSGRCIFDTTSNGELPKGDLFIKKIDGMMGHGAKKLVYSDGFYSDKDGNSFNGKQLLKYVENYSEENYPILLQNVVVNHPSWERFTNSGLATCRIVTFRNVASPEITPLFCTLRMPVGESDVDNFSAGGLAAAINPGNGKLGQAVGYIPVKDKFEFTHHPDTNRKIEGSTIPGWNELLKFTLNLHDKVQSAFVGWDVCLTEKGCLVLEGSLEWGVNVYESPNEQSLFHTKYPVLFEHWLEYGYRRRDYETH